MESIKINFSEWDKAFNNLIRLGFTKTAKSFCNAAISRTLTAISRLESNQHQIHNLFVGATLPDLKAAEELWRDRLKEIS